jgi:enoyl-CoA hydratase
MGEPAAVPAAGAPATTAVKLAPSLDAAAVLEMARAGNHDLPRSALTDGAYLVIELGRHAALTAGDRRALSAWLSRQACPVLGVAEQGIAHAMACGCDVVVQEEAELTALVEHISRAPLTALVLVQLLRLTEGMDVQRALICESLAYATLQAGREFRAWLDSAQRPGVVPVADSGPAVLVERQGTSLDLTLNRPERRNAVSVAMRDALAEALELVLADETISEVCIRGAGPSFSSGGDLAEFGTAADTATAHAVRMTRSVPALLARCAPRLKFRVHGAAVGAGAEMAAFGARIEATPEAFFQLPEIRYGLIPGSGGCVSLPRRIGRLRTAELALSAARLPAARAAEWGLVDSVGAPRAGAAVVGGSSS